MRRPGLVARIELAWHGLGMILRRRFLTQKAVTSMTEPATPADPVDVVGLIAEIRDPDLPDIVRHDAAVILIEKTGLRTLLDVLVVVYGEYPRPTEKAFDVISDAFRTVTTVQSLAR